MSANENVHVEEVDTVEDFEQFVKEIQARIKTECIGCKTPHDRESCQTTPCCVICRYFPMPPMAMPLDVSTADHDLMMMAELLYQLIYDVSRAYCGSCGKLGNDEEPHKFNCPVRVAQPYVKRYRLYNNIGITG